MKKKRVEFHTTLSIHTEQRLRVESAKRRKPMGFMLDEAILLMLGQKRRRR